MPKYDKILTENFLKKEYVENKKSMYKIAKETGAERTTVSYWLKKHNIQIKHRSDYSEDITGKTFNGIRVSNSIIINGDKKWECICKCGKKIITTYSNLIKGQQGCFECRNKVLSQKIWRGYGEISRDVFSTIKRCAKARKIKFNLTIEYLWELFINQERKCALSGEILVFSRNRKINEITASLDRIDSSKGYIKTNVQWVHKDINNMKQGLDESKFIYWCKLISKNKG